MRRFLAPELLLCAAAATAQPQDLPPPFPRTNATKLLETDRIIVWDIVWPEDQPTRRTGTSTIRSAPTTPAAGA